MSSDIDIQSREKLAKLETNVAHIDVNLQQVIKNTQVQHDTLLKLTDAVQQISNTLIEYKKLEKSVDSLSTEVNELKKCKPVIEKLEKKYNIIYWISIGILIGILISIVPLEALPSVILKLLGVPV